MMLFVVLVSVVVHWVTVVVVVGEATVVVEARVEVVWPGAGADVATWLSVVLLTRAIAVVLTVALLETMGSDPASIGYSSFPPTTTVPFLSVTTFPRMVSHCSAKTKLYCCAELKIGEVPPRIS